MVVEILGMIVSVEAPQPLQDEIRGLIADLQVTALPTRQLSFEPERAGTLRLIDNNVVVRTGIAPTLAGATAVWWLNTIVAKNAPHILVHAACVGGRSAVLLPGTSGAGKSMLAAACVIDGLAYLSDEFAALDPASGIVVPYAKPLDLMDTGLIAASAVRPRSVGSALPVGGVVFPRFDNHAPTTATHLSSGWTLLALASHATNLGRLGAPSFPLLAGLSTACPAWQISYADPVDAVSLVRDLAEVPASPVSPAPVIGPITSTTTTVVLGDDLGVFDAETGKVHLLSSVAALVWSAIPDAPASVADLADFVIEQHHDPTPNPSDVMASVDRLIDQGLLPRPEAADQRTESDGSASKRLREG